MFCANCGQQLPDNAVFCKKCGMKVNAPAFEPADKGDNKAKAVQNSSNAVSNNNAEKMSMAGSAMTPAFKKAQGGNDISVGNSQQQNPGATGAAAITRHTPVNAGVQSEPPPLQQDKEVYQEPPVNNTIATNNDSGVSRTVPPVSNQWKDSFEKNKQYIIGALILLLAVGGGVLFSKFLSSPSKDTASTAVKQPSVSTEVKNNSSDTKTNNQVNSQNYRFVIGTDVNVREGASMQAKVKGSYALGEKVLILEEQGEWAKVRRQNGMESFVSRKFLGTQEDLNRRIGNQATAPNIPAGAVVNAYHSSADQEGNYIHSGRLAVDGNTNTCWSEGVKGLGIGQNIEIHFNGNYRVNGMNIWIGHQKSQQLFYQNARPTAVRIVGSDGSNEVYYLNDTFGMQRVNFRYPITVNIVKVVIERVAPGNKYEDTCIAEISFF